MSPDPNPTFKEDRIQNQLDWLTFHRLWGQLPELLLFDLARMQVLLKVGSGELVYEEGQKPQGLYWLKWGTIEIYRQSLMGRSHILYRQAGDALGYIPLLSSNQGQATYPSSAIARTTSELLWITVDQFQDLLRSYPEIQGVFNQLLAQDLKIFTERLDWEQIRIQRLTPYVQPIPRGESVIGQSKASLKLTQQIDQAAQDQIPVVLQAPVGSGKTFFAGLIHARSGAHDRPFIEIDCAQLPRDDANALQTEVLFGKVGGDPGLIEVLERGTLLISNAHSLPTSDRERILQYLKTGSLGLDPRVKTWVRLILAAPDPWPLKDVEHHLIKLFTLSQRKEDISAFATYFLERFCQERTVLHLDQADLRRLISYSYPGNIAELAGILKRAVLMTPSEHSVIPEQVLWSVNSNKNQFRLDLLEQFPWLRSWFLSKGWPEGVWILMMILFVPVTVMGFIGPQTRDASMTLNFFWAWWWPMYLFLFVFVGRVWCAICPFMITGEWIRTLSLWLWPRSLKSWPNRWLNRWGAWILFAGFVMIYLWEKLWDLPHTPYLSSWLLVIITGGAVLGSLVYERRVWCRYLCPIGGMNGMFAKLSMVELRSTQQVCGSQCRTFGCFKGSPATPPSFAGSLTTEGQATGGCPLYSHPAQLQDNRDCVLCMTCLKACPHRSVQLNVRFPAADLLDQHQGFWAEAALMFLLLGGILMHHSDRILGWIGQGNLILDSDHLGVGLPLVIVLLSLPALVILGVDAITRGTDPNRPKTLQVVYAYLPLTLATNLTYYIPAGIREAGRILPVIARTYGGEGSGWPILSFSHDVASFLQGITLISGLLFSFYPLQRITGRSWLSNLPHVGLMIGFTLLCFELMIRS